MERSANSDGPPAFEGVSDVQLSIAWCCRSMGSTKEEDMEVGRDSGLEGFALIAATFRWILSEAVEARAGV